MLHARASILDDGARGDGVHDNRQVIQDAIDRAAAAGGGTVVIPAGRFLTGPLLLASHVELHLTAGAQLIFSADFERHPKLVTRWEGHEQISYRPLIYGKGLENVTISGRGTIDGRGDAWWPLFREGRLDAARPRLIGLEGCRDVRIEGVHLTRSPAWTVNPIDCDDVSIHGVSIVNPPDSPNTDGINPESCRNVRISDCSIDVGDDCIAIKSGTEDADERIPCENIVIANCTMLHGHGGVVIGSESSGDVRAVVISNCVFDGTDRGIRIKSRRGRGGTVEDIRVSNIVMRRVSTPIVMNLHYNCGLEGKAEDERTRIADRGHQPLDEGTPSIRRISLNGITATGVRAAAVWLEGLAERPIQDIVCRDLHVVYDPGAEADYPAMSDGLEPQLRRGIYARHAARSRFTGVTLEGQLGERVQLEHCEDVAVDEALA